MIPCKDQEGDNYQLVVPHKEEDLHLDTAMAAHLSVEHNYSHNPQTIYGFMNLNNTLTDIP